MRIEVKVISDGDGEKRENEVVICHDRMNITGQFSLQKHLSMAVIDYPHAPDMALRGYELKLNWARVRREPENKTGALTMQPNRMRVVNVRDEPCTHYIGRGRGRKEWIRTGLGNIFSTTAQSRRGDISRKNAIETFRTWALEDPRVQRKIAALPPDAVLGCWCKPRPCHGDVIIEIWNDIQKAARERGLPL